MKVVVIVLHPDGREESWPSEVVPVVGDELHMQSGPSPLVVRRRGIEYRTKRDGDTGDADDLAEVRVTVEVGRP